MLRSRTSPVFFGSSPWFKEKEPLSVFAMAVVPAAEPAQRRPAVMRPDDYDFEEAMGMLKSQWKSVRSMTIHIFSGVHPMSNDLIAFLKLAESENTTRKNMYRSTAFRPRTGKSQVG